MIELNRGDECLDRLSGLGTGLGVCLRWFCLPSAISAVLLAESINCCSAGRYE